MIGLVSFVGKWLSVTILTSLNVLLSIWCFRSRILDLKVALLLPHPVENIPLTWPLNVETICYKGFSYQKYEVDMWNKVYINMSKW